MRDFVPTEKPFPEPSSDTSTHNSDRVDPPTTPTPSPTMSHLETKGSTSRAASVVLRLGEVISAAIVLGLLGRMFYLVDNAGVTEPNARLVFAAVIAGMTIVAGLVLMPPMAYTFWAFPVDIFFFAAWLTVFCVLETLTGTNTCESNWYNTYWGYYWGRWYLVSPVGVNVNWTGCSAWRSVLAFSFIACIAFLLSAILGIYWIVEHGRVRHRKVAVFRKREGFRRREKGHVLSKSDPAAPATEAGTTAAPAAGTGEPTMTATPVAAETTSGRVQETV